VLTFVEDHGVISNCEAAGNGDSGIYPGAGADTTDHRYKKFYPKYRYSQVIRDCDSHHNTGGFSGTDSHGTLVTHNNFYDNSLGFTTDVFTAPGHPGFPQHGNVIRDNKFYGNNFNPYQQSSDVKPFIASPVGTGLWLAGGNANVVQGNYFFDNWRRGTMLFAVPDATVCGPPPVGSSTPVPGCNPAGVSTSYDNRFAGNTFGTAPSGQTRPNGLDMWWDSFPGNTGNCFYDNKAAAGKRVTSEPLVLPDCLGGTRPELSVGTGDLANESELVACLAGFTVSGYPAGNGTLCSWTTTPPRPSDGSPLPSTGAPLRVRHRLSQRPVAPALQALRPRPVDRRRAEGAGGASAGVDLTSGPGEPGVHAGKVELVHLRLVAYGRQRPPARHGAADPQPRRRQDQRLTGRRDELRLRCRDERRPCRDALR
jgi:hypothetical protein